MTKENRTVLHNRTSMEEPGSALDYKSALHARIGNAYNNPEYSDCEVVVYQENQKTKFYIHKFMLAAASSYMKKKLYPSDGKGKNLATNDSYKAKSITIRDYSTEVVEYMLRYLYFDELSVDKISDRLNLYNLSRQFKIPDLQKACYHMIKKMDFSLETAIVHYECALAENDKPMIERCRRNVSSVTLDVLSSPCFFDVSIDVLKDILNQNNLNIPDELVLIQFVVEWCKNACKKKGKGIDDFIIREQIDELLPYIRFLSLTSDQFQAFTNKYNFISANESVAITRKICEPRSYFKMEGFSDITKPRTSNSLHENVLSQSVYNKSNLNLNSSSFNLSKPDNKTYTNPRARSNSHTTPEISPVTTPTTSSKYFHPGATSTTQPMRPMQNGPEYQQNYPSYSATQESRATSTTQPMRSVQNGPDRRVHVREKGPHRSLTNGVTKQSPPVNNDFGSTYPSYSSQNNAHWSHDNNSHWPQNSNMQRPQNNHIQRSQSNNNVNRHSPSVNHDLMAGNYGAPPFSMQVSKISKPSKRTFTFHLLEIPKNFHNSSERDVICRMNIHMEKGNMTVHGLQLKIQSLPSKRSETIVVLAQWDGGNTSTSEKKYNLQLQDNFLELQFDQPAVINESSSAEIKLTIEDLRLDRGFQLQANELMPEINAGVDMRAKIKADSYKYRDTKVFLVSQLYYAV